MPPVHFCLCSSKTVRATAMRFWDIVKDSEAIYRRIKFYHISAGNINMAAWKPEVHLGNQRKVVIKSSRHFQWLLSYFHGHLTWVCCWHGFLMSLFTGSTIWLTNKLRKWTEMESLKIWLRNVRYPSRTRRFWHHIRVLFIVLAWVCRCVVIDRHTKIQDGA